LEVLEEIMNEWLDWNQELKVEGEIGVFLVVTWNDLRGVYETANGEIQNEDFRMNEPYRDVGRTWEFVGWMRLKKHDCAAHHLLRCWMENYDRRHLERGYRKMFESRKVSYDQRQACIRLET
jgi:hypothetical protein